MKFAFIILAHKNPFQLRRLIKRLNDNHSTIFLHIDQGVSKHTFRTIQQAVSGSSSLHWLPRSYTHWGSWGLVQASLCGLAKAREAGCDFAILLSGQDYPVQPITALRAFLENNVETSFLQFHALPSPHWPQEGDQRYTRWHFNLGMRESVFRKLTNRTLNRVFNTLFPHRQIPETLSPYGGWQWWCLNQQVISYLLDFTDSHPPVVNFFKTVRIPDEMYFHTVLLNSPLASSVQNRMLTFVDWNGPPFPRTLLKTDFDQLANRDYFFARKFDEGVDVDILDRIDREWLLSSEDND